MYTIIKEKKIKWNERDRWWEEGGISPTISKGHDGSSSSSPFLFSFLFFFFFFNSLSELSGATTNEF